MWRKAEGSGIRGSIRIMGGEGQREGAAHSGREKRKEGAEGRKRKGVL